jgi:hypothetical protein
MCNLLGILGRELQDQNARNALEGIDYMHTWMRGGAVLCGAMLSIRRDDRAAAAEPRT